MAVATPDRVLRPSSPPTGVAKASAPVVVVGLFTRSRVLHARRSAHFKYVECKAVYAPQVPLTFTDLQCERKITAKSPSTNSNLSNGPPLRFPRRLPRPEPQGLASQAARSSRYRRLFDVVGLGRSGVPRSYNLPEDEERPEENHGENKHLGNKAGVERHPPQPLLSRIVSERVGDDADLNMGLWRRRARGMLLHGRLREVVASGE